MLTCEENMNNTKLGVNKTLPKTTSLLERQSGFKKLQGQLGTSFLEVIIALVLAEEKNNRKED